jgi:hypothetical protein
MHHAWQRGEERIEGTLVAAEKTAHDARAVRTAAAAFADQRQRRQRAVEHRHVGRLPHPGCARQDMRVALREHDKIPFAQLDRFLSDRMSPTRTSRDQVVLDHALGTGHHPFGNCLCWRRFQHPGGAQFEVEVHRTRQVDGTEHVRENVSLHVNLSGTDARSSRSDRRSGRSHLRTRGKVNQTHAQVRRPNPTVG